MKISAYFSAEGRMSRSEYWSSNFFLGWAWLIVVLAPIGLIYYLAEQLFKDNVPLWIEAPLMTASIVLGVIVPLWVACASTIKRLHDHNMSGWWLLFMLIPLIGWLTDFVVLGCCAGTKGPNRFGDDPRAPPSSASELATGTTSNLTEQEIKKVYGSQRAYEQHQEYSQKSNHNLRS